MRKKANEAEEEKRYMGEEGVHERKGARKVTKQQRSWTSEQGSTRSNAEPSTPITVTETCFWLSFVCL